ncbi:hypothetical protein HYT01_01710 [Candidatus Giovannonibacteria bacterium]|nr:hypothetical protein [Candidatus Giovannonibacteria bacterium]
MSNYFAKKNISIAGGIILAIALIIFFSLKTTEQGGKESGGIGSFFSGIFPSAGNNNNGEGESPSENATSTPAENQFENAEIVTELPLGRETAKQLPVGSMILSSPAQVSALMAIGTSSIRYYKNVPENLGHLFERNAEGTSDELRLANYTIPKIVKVVWAPNGQKNVIFYDLDGKTRKILIDYTRIDTPKPEFLPDSISDVAFSPDSKSMAFINDLGATQNIFIATSAFKNSKKIFSNNIPGLELSWPASGSLALKPKTSYLYDGSLYTVNTKTGNLTKVLESRGLDAVWSPDGNGVLYSYTDQTGVLQNIRYNNFKTSETTEFDIRTIAEKCGFAKSPTNNGFVFCAVPRNLPDAKYPDDWWQGKVSFSDYLVKINLATGEVTNSAPAFHDVTLPSLTSDDKYFIFKDKNTGSLWSIKIAE